MNIAFTDGDITSVVPPTDGFAIICHCVNDCVGGVMGSGVAAALANKWPQVRDRYMDWAAGNTKTPYRLGEIQIVTLPKKNVYVCNLIGQRECSPFCGIPPIRYEAIREGFYKLREKIKPHNKVLLALPRIGSGLAGGSWQKIEDIVREVFDKSTHIDIVVYTHGPFNP